MDDWRQVWTAIEARGTELGMDREQIYAATHVSEKTFRLMRDAGQPLKSPGKRAQIAIGLKWKPGAIERLLSGEAPEIASVDLKDPVKQLAAIEERLDTLLDLVLKIAESVAVPNR